MVESQPLPTELAARINKSRVVDLEHPRKIGDPSHPNHWPGFSLYLHRRHEPGLPESRSSASGVIITAEHSGTHIDALCHQAEGLRMTGGIPTDPTTQGPHGFSQLAMDSVAPILAPGVLLDVAALKGGRLPEGYLITVEDLEQCEANQRVTVAAESVVLIRTGYGAVWSENELYLRAAGVSGAGAEWLAARRVRAVGIDNVALDVLGHRDEATNSSLPCHLILIVRNGIHILENLNLEELSELRANEFTFICLPLKIIGGTGCPVRPVALVEVA